MHDPRPHRRAPSASLLAASLVLGATVPAHAQIPAEAESSQGAPPSVAAGAESNRERYRLPAARVDQGPLIDGILDDNVWASAPFIDEFIQQEPVEGAPSTVRTEVRVLYDQENLYLAIRADDPGPETVVATEMRRDGAQILNEDNFQIILDTFMDSRSAYMFVISPLGAMLDQQVVQEGEGSQRGTSSNINLEWDGVWDTRARRTPEGWVAEVRIPMVTLRFPGTSPQSWGINFMRNIPNRNEVAFWAPVPRAYGLTRVSLAGTLTGLEDLNRGLDLRVKPYVTGGGRRRLEGSASDNSTEGDAGLDVKYGITPSLNLDVTVNTDFAQAEVDNEQVNLTRFPLFFPEKRDFFLENAGQFNVGTTGSGQRADLFFTRQIGLTAAGDEVPILAGARVTGKVGRNNIALMDIQTDDAFGQQGENFLVARYARDVLSRSKIGGLVVNRQASGADYNRTYAADAAFAFGPSLRINGFLAQTESPGISSGQEARYFRAHWLSPAWDIYLDHVDLGDNFNAGVGFVPRVGVRSTKLHINRTPRPGRWGIRVMTPMWHIVYTTDQAGRLVYRELHHMIRFTFENNANFTVVYNRNFERLDPQDAFRVRGIDIPAGDYSFYDLRIGFNSNPARRVSYGVTYNPQGYYDGDRTDLTFRLGSRITSKFSAEASYARNDVSNLPGNQGFVTELGSLRVDYTFSPTLSLRTLTQYNSSSDQWSTSARLRYIYRPGSDLYIVYDEVRRDINGIPLAQEFRDRRLIIKATYLLSM